MTFTKLREFFQSRKTLEENAVATVPSEERSLVQRRVLFVCTPREGRDIAKIIKELEGNGVNMRGIEVEYCLNADTLANHMYDTASPGDKETRRSLPQLVLHSDTLRFKHNGFGNVIADPGEINKIIAAYGVNPIRIGGNGQTPEQVLKALLSQNNLPLISGREPLDR